MEAGGGVQETEGSDVDGAVDDVAGGVDLDDVHGPHPGVAAGQKGGRLQFSFGANPATAAR